MEKMTENQFKRLKVLSKHPKIIYETKQVKRVHDENARIKNEIAYLIANDYIIEVGLDMYHLIGKGNEIAELESYAHYIDYIKNKIKTLEDQSKHEKALDIQLKEYQISEHEHKEQIRLQEDKIRDLTQEISTFDVIEARKRKNHNRWKAFWAVLGVIIGVAASNLELILRFLQIDIPE